MPNHTLKPPVIDIKNIELMKSKSASTAPNTWYFGRIFYIEARADSDNNTVYLQQPPYNVSGTLLFFTVKPNTGLLGQNIWIVINTALINNQGFYVHTDSNNYIDEVMIANPRAPV